MKHLGTIEIETERLILRRFTVEDAPKMFANWASDPEMTKYMTWQPYEEVGAVADYLRGLVSDYDKDTSYHWCMTLKENDEPIGAISAVHVDELVQSVEIGYGIGRCFRHRGYTSEAMQAVMDFFFGQVGVNRVEARHDARNPHSGAVMKKCGMLYEGTKVEGGWNNSGICDSVLYGLTVTQRRQAAGGNPDAGRDSARTGGYVSAGKNAISDETMEYVGILAKLELSGEEKTAAKRDMERMLDYIDKLNELDTSGVEPMSHVFPVNNVFREDVVENADGGEDTLANAPEARERAFVVPKTVDQ